MPDPPERPAADGQPAPPGDGGVLARVRHRNAVVAAVVAVPTTLLVVTAAAWPGWAADSLTTLLVAVLGAVLGALAVGWLGLRSRRWDRLARLGAGPGGVPASIGAPVPLHPLRPGQPIKRRLAATVLPVRAEIGRLAGGDALVVHARRDRLQLAAGDPVDVVAARPDGPFLLIRRTDGAVFAAEHGIFAAV